MNIGSEGQRAHERSRSRSRDRRHKRHKSRRRSSESRSPEQPVDPIAMNFYNIDRSGNFFKNSVIGSMIINDYQLTPLLFGFGVPQRTQSYIIGRPK